MNIMGFESTNVQGLYNYLHFERADGAWFQIPLPFGREKYIIWCDQDSPPRKLEWQPDGDIAHWEAMMAALA